MQGSDAISAAMVACYVLHSSEDLERPAHTHAESCNQKSSACTMMYSECKHAYKKDVGIADAHALTYLHVQETLFLSHSPTHAHRNPFLIFKYTHRHTHMLSPTGAVE